MLDKKRRIIVSALVVALLFVALFRYVDTYPGIEKEEIDQKIIFLWMNFDSTGGYRNYGVFVDGEGNEVEYDLTDKGWIQMTFEEQLSYLENMEYGERNIKRKIEVSELKKYYSYLYKINPDARIIEYSSFYRSYDTVQTALYGVAYLEEGVPMPILINSKGEDYYVNTNRYAKKIATWWGNQSANDNMAAKVPLEQ